jgi:hypothetical protein
MIKRIYIILIVLGLTTLMFNNIIEAQGYLINNNSYLVLSPGTQLYLTGSFINQNSGLVNNQGTIALTGNWTNNATNNVFVNPAQGTVILDGPFQTVGGTGQTWFNNLVASGSGNKNLAVITRAKGVVSLNDKEINLGTSRFFIDNSAVSAITRTTGYINTSSGGWLVRYVNAAGAYSFPVGTNVLYRPVDITSGTVASDTFGVRFIDHSPSLNGYDVNLKEASLCEVNSGFYHRIMKGTGSLVQAGIKIYFDSLTDGHFDRIAHWQNVPQWENTSSAVLNYQASPDLSSVAISNWSLFIPSQFALAKSSVDATITPVLPVCVNTAPFNLLAASTGGTWSGTGITDPLNGVFDPSIAGSGTFQIQYTVNSGNGCFSTDTVIVSVNPLPDAGFTYSVFGGTATFTNTSSYANTYSWDFGDGNTDNSTSPSHTYIANGQYIIQLIANNLCGSDTIYDTIDILTIGISTLPEGSFSVYPNPFDNSTLLEYVLIDESSVQICLFDILGKQIMEYADFPKQPAGRYFVEINESQIGTTHGVYILRVTINHQETKRYLVHL